MNTIRSTEEAVLAEARRVNEERMKTVHHLATIVAQRVELEERLKDNAKDERRAVREAEKAGWTPAQIKRFMKPPRSNSPAHEAAQNTAVLKTNSPNISDGASQT